MIYLLIFLLVLISPVDASQKTYGNHTVEGYLTATGLVSSVSLQNTSLLNCDTVDTDSAGNLKCGTDATGGGGTQNLWETISANPNGNTIADSITDILTVTGETGITARISGDTLTIGNSISGGGDNITINSSAVNTTADFQNGTIDWTLTGDTDITAALDPAINIETTGYIIATGLVAKNSLAGGGATGLLIEPEARGDVELFKNTNVADTASGKKLIIHRKATEGNGYIEAYTSAAGDTYINGRPLENRYYFVDGLKSSNGAVNVRFNMNPDSGDFMLYSSVDYGIQLYGRLKRIDLGADDWSVHVQKNLSVNYQDSPPSTLRDEVDVKGGVIATGISVSTTMKAPHGTTPPATCNPGEIFVDTDADTNSSLLICISDNTWKDVDDD